MTEAEAKTKWCPFARVAGTHPHTITPAATDALTAVNRCSEHGHGLAQTRCLGSGCMAWRNGVLVERKYQAESPGDGWRRLDDMAMAAAWERRTPTGYCGAFGRAE